MDKLLNPQHALKYCLLRNKFTLKQKIMTKDILNLLKELKKLDANLYLEKGELKLDIQKELLTTEIVEAIKANKAEIITLLHNNKSTGKFKINKCDPRTTYPLSSAQLRLWVLGQFEKGSVAYNMPYSVRLEGDYDIPNFKRSIWSILERHEILRTVFRENPQGEIQQLVLESSDLNFEIGHENYSGGEAPEQQALKYIEEDSYLPFDLEKGPLLRVCLLQLSDSAYILYYNIHHIIGDGWSMGILYRDMLSYYQHYTEGTTLNLPELQIQYKDYAVWQRENLEKGSLEVHKQYWVDKLSGDLPMLDLPCFRQRPKLKTYNGRQLHTYLNKEDTAAIRSYISENGGTLFMFLVASLKVLLYRYSGQEDLIMGTPVAGREHPDLEDQIGFYINTLALRSTIKGTVSFDEFYTQIKQDLLNAYAHQMYPLDQLIEELDLKRDASRSALFDVMVVLQNAADTGKELSVSPGHIGRVKDLGATMSKFDLSLNFTEVGEHIGMGLIYNTDIYGYDIVEALMNHYQQLVREIVEQSKIGVGELSYLSKSEEAESLYQFNPSELTYPSDKTIIDLFEEQANEKPDNIAVVFGEVELTYRELDERSNQLANYLREQYAITTDDLIGVKLERSEWMIISMLATLKSGGAYLPIDPNYPQERVDYMVADSNCKALINQEVLGDFIKNREKYMSSQLESDTKASDLAYVIYTSGSTGQPKGVMIEHRSIVSLFSNDKMKFDFNSEDVWCMYHSFCFDFSVWEMYGALLNGGKLIVPNKTLVRDPFLFSTFVYKNGITVLNLTPSAFNSFQKHLIENEAESSVRYLIFGGEALTPSAVKGWYKKFPGCKIINMYGITEITIHATYKEITPAEIKSNVSNIGMILPTLNGYIFDDNLKLTPRGVTGEFCIGGLGLARGYLNRPDLTSEKFVENPFVKGERIYRSGDLVRRSPNGDLEFMGRKDDQVKIRGHRIELGEIEGTLSLKKELDAAVVLARKSSAGSQNLVAYYCSLEPVTTKELRDYLQERLPSFMIPNYFVHLQKFPLTSNGKINKKALPNPEELNLTDDVEYVAPKSKMEKQVVAIWETVLERKPIGIKDGFFSLGGHSLKAIRLISEYHKMFGVKLSIAEVFSNISPASHVQLLLVAEQYKHEVIPAIPVAASYPLSDPQNSLWVLSQFEGGNNSYNIPS